MQLSEPTQAAVFTYSLPSFHPHPHCSLTLLLPPRRVVPALPAPQEILDVMAPQEEQDRLEKT